MKKSGFVLLACLGLCHVSSLAQVGKVGINTTSPAAMLHVMDSSVVFTAPASLPPTPALPPVSGNGIRMMWYAEKGAFRTGRVLGPQWDRDSIGVLSFASGLNTKAKGAQAIAMGNGSNATATGSVAIGSNANATSGGSLAMGTNTTASGNSATALGTGTSAAGTSSMAMGSNSIASGNISTAMGASTMATGNNSTAMGASSKAMGVSSTAMGNGTQAMGTASTSAGFNTRAMGSNSTSLGLATQANGFSSLTAGQYNDTIVAPQSSITATTPLLIVGNGDPGMPSNALVVRKDGRVGIGTNSPAATLDINGQLKISGGNPGAGKVLTSDATGLATWETSAGGADNLGNHMATQNLQTKGFYISHDGGSEGLYVDTIGRVGIGHSSPVAQLHIKDKSVLFDAPDPLPGSPPPAPFSGTNARMLWYAEKASLRSGLFNQSHLVADSIGNYSFSAGINNLARGSNAVAFGVGTRARGLNSLATGSSTEANGTGSMAAGAFSKATRQNAVALGLQTLADGDNALTAGANTVATSQNTVALGSGSTASGPQSMAIGAGSTASGSTSFATGGGTKAKGTNSISAGQLTIANGFASTAIGYYNDSIVAPQTSISPTTPLFMVGNGDGINSRSNAMVVRKDGRVGIGTSSPQSQLHLEQGTVLFRGPDNLPSMVNDLPDPGFGNRFLWFPEKTALRAATNSSTDWNKDSIGYGSIAAGYDVVASGFNSAAFGIGGHASGNFTLIAGNNCHASADFGASFGWNNHASGTGGFSIGFNTIASGNFSIASGHSSEAAGSYASVLGWQTKANGYSSLVVGIHNDTLVSSQNSITPQSPLLIVGNGDDATQRSNALVVRKDGNVGIGNINPQYGLHVVNRDGGEGGIVEGIMVESLHATAGEAGISFRNVAVPAANKWSVGINQSPPNLSFNYGSTFSSANTHVAIDTLGKMGINTTSPAAMLHVVRVSPSGGMFHPSAHSIFESSNISYMQLSSENADETGILSGNQSTSIRSAIIFQADSALLLRAGGNTTRLAILKTGHTGIGTSAPACRLHVRNASSGATPYVSSDLVVEDNADALLSLVAPSTSTAGIVFANPTNNLDGSILYNTISNPNGMEFRCNGNSTRMLIDNTGNVGIGTSTPTFRLQVSTNSAAKPSSNTWTIASDARLKTNIRDYTDGLDAILRIHPVWFTYTGEAGLPKDTGVGILAQELQEIAPYMVGTWNHTAEDGRTDEYLSVDNGAMTYMLINAVKEQQKVIQTQQSELDALRRQLADIKSMVEQIVSKTAEE